MIKKKILRMVLWALFLSLFLYGCDSLFTTSIQKILENPRNYAGKTVTVSGEVTRVFSLIIIKYFVLRDSTGEVTVVTEKPLPKVGLKMKVKGTVEEAFAIGDQQLIVIFENGNRRERGRP